MGVRFAGTGSLLLRSRSLRADWPSGPARRTRGKGHGGIRALGAGAHASVEVEAIG
jgi:hypothetical protein